MDTNGLSHKLTHKMQTNASLTDLTNTYSINQTAFLKKCRQINEIQQRPFSVLDFPGMSQGNFRYFLLSVKDKIELVIKSKPNFYKVIGTVLPIDFRRLTDHHTRGNDFFKILEDLKLQPAMIHDIKIKVENTDLHKTLLDKGCTPDKNNHSIPINFNADSNIITKIVVYPNTIQIDLGCTFKPLVYNSSTIWHLMEHLSKISYHITELSSVQLPKVSEWIITHYHLNKDGTLALNGQSFNFEFEEVSNGLIRYYTKKFEDSTHARLEQIKTPQIPLSEMLEGIIEK